MVAKATTGLRGRARAGLGSRGLAVAGAAAAAPPPAAQGAGAAPRARGPARAGAKKAGPLLVMHLADTTVQFPVQPDVALELHESLKGLAGAFQGREERAGAKPARLANLDFEVKGEEAGDVAVAAFCNPNGYANALVASVLVTVSTQDGVKVMSETKLSKLRDDVEYYLETYGFL